METMKIMEKIKNLPKKTIYIILGITVFVLINIIGLVIYYSKNS